MSYEVSDPTVDSQIIQLKDSGANVLFTDAAPKAAAQAIRKVADLGWKPAHSLANVAASVASTLKPAGQQQGHHHRGLPQGSDRPAMDYAVSCTMRHVLTACGDTLTRANLMKQAASMKKLVVPLLLPGISINTSATDLYPIQSVQLARFDGETWKLFGDVLSNEGS